MTFISLVHPSQFLRNAPRVFSAFRLNPIHTLAPYSDQTGSPIAGADLRKKRNYGREPAAVSFRETG